MTALKSLRVRASQGTQFIPDLRRACPLGFRGLPVLSEAECEVDCARCREACPTRAIGLRPLSLDLGRCVFASSLPRLPRRSGAFHVRTEDGCHEARRPDRPRRCCRSRPHQGIEHLSKLFGRSLKLRQVSAGGCNACELELNAIVNVNFDAQRFGIEWVASPRHADALVLSGTLTRNMRDAVRLAWDAMPAPRFLVAVERVRSPGGCTRGPLAWTARFSRAWAPLCSSPAVLLIPSPFSTPSSTFAGDRLAEVFVNLLSHFRPVC